MSRKVFTVIGEEVDTAPVKRIYRDCRLEIYRSKETTKPEALISRKYLHSKFHDMVLEEDVLKCLNQLQNIIFSKCSHQIPSIMHHLRDSRELRTLSLSYCDFSKYYFEIIDTLRSCTNLRVLIITDTEIDNCRAIALWVMLPQLNQLELHEKSNQSDYVGKNVLYYKDRSGTKTYVSHISDPISLEFSW